jgi:CHAT domain-containing protein
MLVPTIAPTPYKQILLLAERDPVAAVKQARQIEQHADAADSCSQAWSSFTLGWSLLRSYELPAALVHLQHAHSAFQAIGQQEMVLHARRAILIAELAESAVAEHDTAWDQLAADYRLAGHDRDAVRTQVHQIGYFNVIGLPQAALELGYLIEHQVQTRGTVDDRARWLRVMGLAYKHAGQLHQAQAHLEQAAALFGSLDYPVEVAKCWLEQVHVAERQGAFAQARNHLNAALAVFQTFKLWFLVAVCQKNLGIVASWLGKLDQALSLSLQARSTFVQCGQHEQAASCDLSLGNVALYSGLFDLAFVAYQRAQTTYMALGLRRQLLIAQRNQALVFAERGQFSAAYHMLCDLEVQVAALGDVLELAEVYQAQAQVLHRLGRYDAAVERLALAEHQLAHLGRQVGVAECWLERAQISLHLGDPSTAEAWLEATQEICEDQPIYTWRVLHSLGRCVEARGAIEAALDHYQTACNLIARLRHTLVNEHASSAFFRQAHEVYEDAIRLAVATHHPLLVLHLAEQQRALTHHQRLLSGHLHIPASLAASYQQQQQAVRNLLHTPATPDQYNSTLVEYIDLLLQLVHSDPWSERLPPVPPDIQDVRRACDRLFPQGWVVLNYIEYETELVIIVLDSEQVTLTRRRLDLHLTRLLEQTCLDRLRRYTFNDLPRLRDPTRASWEVLRQLADALLPPTVRARLDPDLRLLIVPSEHLHCLPWATLRLDESWLCEQAIVQIIPSLAVWERYTSYAIDTNNALLIGCSEFGARASSLIHIEAELKVVEEIWTGPVTRLYNEQATRAAVLEQSEQHQLATYDLIHIATHAQLSAARGLLAHVMLWDDDLLYDEISRLQLNGALVVLSTCDGAASEVLSGDEVMNVSRAFLAAGARDVIANVWPSYDSLGPIMMRLLYTYLDAGFDAAHAVAQMQRSLLDHADGQIDIEAMDSSPLTWGGFHAVGSGLTRLGSASGTPR